jgi:hypothetical protein
MLNTNMALPYTREQIEEAVKHSRTYADVYRQLGLKINGGSYNWMRNMIKKHGLDISHFKTRKELMAEMTELSNINRGINLYDKDDISNGERLSSQKLQSFMKFKGISHTCNVCGLNEWMGKPIRLDIDHMDGRCDNNHIDNLQYICPNCHRQKTIVMVETKKGIKTEKSLTSPRPSITRKKCIDCDNIIEMKAIRCKICHYATRFKIDWPSSEDLQKMIWEKPTSILSKELGVADTAIAKRCRKLGIPKPPRGYWQKMVVHAGLEPA